MSDATDPDREPMSTEKKLSQLYALIDGIDVAMMTTRAADGSLVSRPMSTQTRDPGTDIWFMTVLETGKVKEIASDAHVNLGYYKANEWVSVAGRARVTQDRAKIRKLYKPDWKAWLADEGGERNGGPDDPRIALIEVQALSATYLKSDRPGVVAFLQMVAGIVTGQPPKLGDLGELNSSELAQGAGKKP